MPSCEMGKVSCLCLRCLCSCTIGTANTWRREVWFLVATAGLYKTHSSSPEASPSGGSGVNQEVVAVSHHDASSSCCRCSRPCWDQGKPATCRCCRLG